MGYKLEKPYKDKQRADFVHEHQGLNYYEDDNCIIMYSDSESVENGVVTDISGTDAYKAKIKKQQNKQALTTRDKALSHFSDSVASNKILLDLGIISQDIYDSRLLQDKALANSAITTFNTILGITNPTFNY